MMLLMTARGKTVSCVHLNVTNFLTFLNTCVQIVLSFRSAGLQSEYSDQSKGPKVPFARRRRAGLPGLLARSPRTVTYSDLWF